MVRDRLVDASRVFDLNQMFELVWVADGGSKVGFSKILLFVLNGVSCVLDIDMSA